LFAITGVDLSKILGGQTKILGGAKDGKSDKRVGVSQLLGARARAAPQSLRLCNYIVRVLPYNGYWFKYKNIL